MGCGGARRRLGALWWVVPALLGACSPPEAETAVVVTLEMDEQLGERASSLSLSTTAFEIQPVAPPLSDLPEHIAFVASERAPSFPVELRASVLGASDPTVVVEHVFRHEMLPGRVPWARMRLWDDGCTPEAQQACQKLGERICCQGRCQTPPDLRSFPEWGGTRPTEPFPQDALWCPPVARGDDPVVGLDAGYGAYCAVTEAGRVFCWGLIGWPGEAPGLDGGRVRQVPLPDGTKAEQVAVGFGFACALLSETGGAQRVRCWGGNRAGQLGVAPTAPGESAWGEPNLPPDAGPIAEIDAGGAFACVRTQAGKVFCWGDAARGQLGLVPLEGMRSLMNATQVAPVPEPQRIDLQDASAQVLALGWAHACIIGTQRGAAQRGLWCWGNHELAQTGFGAGIFTAEEQATARRIRSIEADDGSTAPLDDPRLLATGFATSCVLQGAALACWGLWPRTLSDVISQRPRFVSMPPSSERVVDLAAVEQLSVGGGFLEAGGEPFVHLCARDTDGVVSCLGSLGRGQLGPWASAGVFSTQWNTVFWGRVDGLAAGVASTCALRTWGELLCWGDAAWGQLGRVTQGSEPRPLPQPVQWPDAAP